MVIKYGGIEYEVEYLPTVIGDDGEEKLGGINPAKLKMAISLEQSRDSVQITTIHELIHIMAAHAGQEFTEGQIDSLSYAFFQLNRENPDFWGNMNTNGQTTSDKPKSRRIHS